MNATQFEECMNAMQGTPQKRSAAARLPSSAPGEEATRRGRTPVSRPHGDRFIPQRSAMDMDVSHFELTRAREEENATVNASPAKARPLAPLPTFKRTSTPFPLPRPSSPPTPPSGGLPFTRPPPCQLPSHPPASLQLLDDYYLNLLDWNERNVLGVALGDSIYLWNASDGSIQQLMQTSGDNSHVTSLSWVQDGPYMAVGTSDHKVQIWDVEKLKQVRSMSGHRARVSSLSWNGRLVSSGQEADGAAVNSVRVADHKVGTLRGHAQEVCGLKWSPSGTQLASGGNDNILNVWDDRYTSSANGVCDQPLLRLDQHRAAVKALAWCPWQRNLLASGGGTADRMIRFWNSSTGACLNAVCALQWAKHDRELVSSHGYSHNQLILWKYPSMVKVAELTGHTSRVLHMAQSPDGTTVVTAAADETLRFWKILSGGEASKKERAAAKESILNSMSIR
ncbi:hypothetical protein EMIHUDRAFT_417498 [Emiliania huxleyi CCMP1516]|uniref:CDC20/Fizzy WD40 domain-containing protein n=2 Tax=Emiliania huxleyi TaxID=2903 RepID=A0A0D3KTD7_EMIH1|nr:hypothetical protein EMIHUDRAFT_417498 [Emiliania huxleyi CCMP1516]EOD39022.1 hypothetical protein EMIHUDRAFT_417498 [Emiliania huxleyi CCMP1516]|eukprot:XP_005791451.1 hypothetical protein EMIHUDRAFT_417498 [Emiliania huxleyi CCMP1516]